MSSASPSATDSLLASPALSGLLEQVAQSAPMAELLGHVGDERLHVHALGPARPWLIGALSQVAPLLVVTPTSREAEDLSAELTAMVGDQVAWFPAWETLPHERLSPGVDIVGQRARVLHRLNNGTDSDIEGQPRATGSSSPIPGQDAGVRIVVTAARGYAQPVIADPAMSAPVVLTVGEEYPFDQLEADLVHRAYKRVDLVAVRGEFAVRGGIIDIFPTTFDHPVRVDFWGDEVTGITQFAVADQRTYSDSQMQTAAVYPARALLINADVQARAAELARQFTGNPALTEILAKVSEGMPADGMEVLIPALLGPSPSSSSTASPSSGAALVPLTELMPDGTHVLLLDPERIRMRVGDLSNTDEEFLAAGWEAAAMGASSPLTGSSGVPVAADGLDLSASSYRSYQSLEVTARNLGAAVWTITPPGMLEEGDVGAVTIPVSLPPAPRGDEAGITELFALLLAHTRDGGAAAYITPTAANGKRFAARLREAGIAHTVASSPAAPGAFPASSGVGAAPGSVTIYQAFSHHGVVFAGSSSVSSPASAPCSLSSLSSPASASSLPLVIVTETDLTGNRVGDIAGAKRRKAKKRNRVDPLALKPGDYVVHEIHGVGKFVDMVKRTTRSGEGNSEREYILLEYAPSRRGGPGDRLYVPMESLDLLTKYVGSDAPSLSKMGGSDWKNTKRKARAAVKEIAAELVQLYAKRQATPGHAFGADTPWQLEMEDNFEYVETEDQQLAIDQVKADMEKPQPMDRIIVGDVGYGKTEVAVRAAFKCVQDGMQVAVLVPTTLLAQQHEVTFRERMAGFPIRIEQLSRFTPASTSRDIIAGLASGEIDVVIGTHRLLQTGVRWKNLGLIIVDEEQRFGVEHKEHIKALKAQVDVLTMSATPIPRTLEMSLTGIREMSTILTPPQDRRPVLTYVGPQEDKQVAAAIRRELLRDGQVFYVHNRVASIEKRARQLRELLPEARIAIAHGQMSEDLLEKTVEGFWNRDYDVLLCTTIIETGLDIANANTLIVEDSHRMGLSQLHQLRGRVGRSRERAYAYFLYPKGEVLTEIAYERLSTIAQNNEMGAGMAVAMKDLEMRGAGNVLGAQQSGHINGVGFDLYVRLVEDAVEAYKALASGTPYDATQAEPEETRIDLPVDANLPESYIGSDRLRLEVYRKLAAARSDSDLDHVVEEMEDRYGPLPTPAQLLVAVGRLRVAAHGAGITDISVQGTRIKVHPLVLSESKQVRLRRLYPGATYRAVAQAVQLSVPKEGEEATGGRGGGARVGAPPLRDKALITWLSRFIATMSE